MREAMYLVVAALSAALVGNPALPARTLADLIADAKGHPGNVTVSSTGIGSQGHITLEALKTGFIHLPCNNTAEQNFDLISSPRDRRMINAVAQCKLAHQLADCRRAREFRRLRQLRATAIR